MKRSVITGIVIGIIIIGISIIALLMASYSLGQKGYSDARKRLDEDIKKSEEALRGYGVNPSF
jgi:hypothetical protein